MSHSTSPPENTVLSESHTTIHCTSTRSPTIHLLSYLDKFQLPLAQDYHHPPLTPRNLDKSSQLYNDALRSSGYIERIQYEENRQTRAEKNRIRSQKLIWLNPHFSQNVQTNVAMSFLHLIDKHFPKSHKLLKMFTKNNLKVSYSHCQQQQSYSGLPLPGWSNSTYFWNDSWVQTFHSTIIVKYTHA